MFNKATLVGRLARAPELKSFDNGGSICKLRLITSSNWRDHQTGEIRERTEGHNIVIHVDKMGRRISEACTTGDILLIEGAIETRRYKDTNGQTRYITEIAIRPYQGTVRRMPTPARKLIEKASNGDADTKSGEETAQPEAQAEVVVVTGDGPADIFDDWGSEGFESLDDSGQDFPF
ncbi:single-stranded DNA-binding protein [Loktanella sp. DJP18]|uniref:single-stranded DNA-binding protein n=1 Tax=Loktanella sp. DJP18 TaxID=3409788 RepID=UPI003BB740B1